MRVIELSEISVGIIGKNNWGLNVHKMRWAVYIETTKEHQFEEGVYQNPNGIYIKRVFVGNKHKCEKWIKEYDSSYLKTTETKK